jgi:hypothetical protein
MVYNAIWDPKCIWDPRLHNKPWYIGPVLLKRPDDDFIKVGTCRLRNILCNKLLCLTGFIPCINYIKTSGWQTLSTSNMTTVACEHSSPSPFVKCLFPIFTAEYL